MCKKVYVIQHPARGGYVLDLSKANEFGEIQEACFDSSRVDITKNTESVVCAIREYLKDFTEGDSLLQVGEHTLFSASCAIASESVDYLNILKWDRNTEGGGGYYSSVAVQTYTDEE